MICYAGFNFSISHTNGSQTTFYANVNSFKAPVAVSTDETMDIGGVPLEHQEERVARIFRPTREATQTPWNNTKVFYSFLNIPLT